MPELAEQIKNDVAPGAPRSQPGPRRHVHVPEERTDLVMAVVTLITMMIARGDARRLDIGAPEPIAAAPDAPHMSGMEAENRRRRPRKPHPLLRQFFFLLGILLIIGSPLVGAIPGPGGVIVFAAGLALVLKNSEWAKRQYVRFKRRHPNKGRWADWGMRRTSARRRETLHRAVGAGSVIEVGREPASGD